MKFPLQSWTKTDAWFPYSEIVCSVVHFAGSYSFDSHFQNPPCHRSRMLGRNGDSDQNFVTICFPVSFLLGHKEQSLISQTVLAIMGKRFKKKAGFL